MMQGRNYTLGGGRLGNFVLQDTELRPLFCEDWLIAAEEEVLGGGDWMLISWTTLGKLTLWWCC